MNGMKVNEKTTLRYWFEWYTPALWGKRGYVSPRELPLSGETVAELERLTQWHDSSMNWYHLSAPGPWRQEECDRFNSASDALYRRICEELGSNYEVINEQGPLNEDPGLDEYLRDPDAYILARSPWLRDFPGRQSAKTTPFGTP